MKWPVRLQKVFANMIPLSAKNRFPYLAKIIFSALALLTGSGSVMAAGTLPVPTVTIYPGDNITTQVLRDRRFSDRFMALGGYLRDYEKLVGKVARRTLVRGKPIPTSAVRQPFAVRNGQVVTLQFKSGSLFIMTKAISLKSAAAGEFISTRNVDTGRTVMGMVQTDGSVLVLGK